uniref:Extensin domain-containing protein n=1 Tax=Salix viminalis TaxID=40686 RepID=A0A6N2MRK1_SALVM
MDFNLTPFLYTLLFASVLANLPSLTTSDVGECPYPCYPPPTGTGTPTVTTPPPPPSKSAGSYPPPGYASPTDQDLPFYPPPPFGNNLYGLPPPDLLIFHSTTGSLLIKLTRLWQQIVFQAQLS